MNGCLIPSVVKPIADKYNVSVNSMETAIYLYTDEFKTETFNENDESFKDFMDRYFNHPTQASFENESKFNRAYEIWKKYNGTYEVSNPENRKVMVDAYKSIFGDGNVVVYTDSDDNVIIKFSEPTLNGYTQEMLDIKEKALKDGTFMKAPNGKPTNLNEKQWLQVRTKAFKEWFGDWEKATKIKNATVIWGHPGTGKTWLFNQGRKDIIDFDSEYKAKLGNLEERKALKDKIGKDAYNAELDKLFEEAKQEAIKSGRKLLVSDLHFLRHRASDMDVITNISDAEFIERSHQRGEHDEADKMEWKNSINKAMQTAPSDRILNTTGYISDLIDNSDISKVVDENGEPLVVYHGSKNNFTKFDYDHLKKADSGFFFTSDNNYANNFGNSGAFFLNIKNPNNTEEALDLYSVETLLTTDYKIGTDGIIGHDNPNTGENIKSNGTEYVALNPNQIKSATDNVGTFSRENNDIQYSIITEPEYKELLEELELSRETSEMFLVNFFDKVLGVKPKNKVDYKDKAFNYFNAIGKGEITTRGFKDLQKLYKKIFGYDVYDIPSMPENKEEVMTALDRELENWEDKLKDLIANDNTGLDEWYGKKRDLLDTINLLQRFLHRNLNKSDFTENEIDKINKTFGDKVLTKQLVGFKIQKLKEQAKAVEQVIALRKMENNAKLIARKNRLVALRTIDNIKDIIRKRISAEIDSRIAKPSIVKEKSDPFKELATAINNVVESKEMENRSDFLFKDKTQKEITYAELKEIILKDHKEFETLLNLFEKANPKLKIFVGGDPERQVIGSVAGKFHPKSNTLTLTNVADVYTTIHELAHSATYFGMMGSADGVNTFDKKINQFMDYIRDYIDKNQLNPALFNEYKIMGATMPAEIYGFTNASEFIAELFGNPRFQEMLSLIPPMENKKFKSLLSEIWDAIVNFLNNISGNKIRNTTALNQAKKLGYASMMLQQEHIQDFYDQLKEIEEREANEQKIANIKDDVVCEMILKGESSDKQLNEKFGNKTETTAVEILNKLKEFNSPFTPLINTLLENLDELLPNLKLRLVDSDSLEYISNKPNAAAVYDPDTNWIYVAKDASFKGKNGAVDATVLHEIFHAIVRNSLKTAEHKEALQKIFDSAKESIFKKYGVSSVKELRAKSKYFNETFYGLESLDEFVSEFFTNGRFVVELNKIGPKAKSDSVVGKMLGFIKSLFKKFFKKESQLYSEASALIEDIMLNANQVYRGYMLDDNIVVANEKAIKGENISSSGSALAKKLTNPGNNITVNYKGIEFRNAEHAYQTWKSGSFDAVAYNSKDFIPRGRKPADKKTNYNTMVEILTAKFLQHPELIDAIDKKGGIAYIKASTHNVKGDQYWETDSGQNKFIEALADAYNNFKEAISKDFEELSEEERLNIVEKEVLNFIETCKKHFGFNKEGHYYFVKNEEGKQISENITNTASTYIVEGPEGEEKLVKNGKWQNPKEKERFDEYWATPSTTLGDNVDEVLRDGFTPGKEMKDKYENIDDDTLESIKSDINLIKNWAKGVGLRIINADFPMVTKRTYEEDGEIKTEYIAGAMDLIGYDADGNIYTFDIKNKHSKNLIDKLQEDYDGQQNIYNGMLKALLNRFGGEHLKVSTSKDTLRIIQFTTEYPSGFEYKYRKVDGELYLAPRVNNGSYKVEKEYSFENMKSEEEIDNFVKENWIKYEDWAKENSDKTTKLVIIDEETPEQFRLNVFDQLQKQIESLSDEELDIPKKKIIEQTRNEARKENRVRYQPDREDIQQMVLYSSGIKNSDLMTLANNVMDELSTMYDCLQGINGEEEAKAVYCEILNANTDTPIDRDALDDKKTSEYKEFERITSMDRDSIMKEIPITKTLVAIKNLFVYTIENEDGEEVEITEDKAINDEERYIIRTLKLCHDNFDGLVNIGYQRLILLENKAITSCKNEELKQDGEQDTKVDIETVGNKDLEHWMIEHMSNKASLSGEWRRIIAKMAVVKDGEKELNKFGFIKRMDENAVINNLLTWFKGCTELQEMIDILEKRCKYYPEYRQILNLIKYKPGEKVNEQKEALRSRFFQNFRKDFQTYSIVIVDTDPKTGKPTYTNMVINTSTASTAVLSELGRKFHLGFEFTEKLFPIDKNGSIDTKYVKDLNGQVKRLEDVYKKELKSMSRSGVSSEIVSENLLNGPFFDSFKNLLKEFGLNLNEQTLKMLIYDTLALRSTTKDAFRDNDSINEIFRQLGLALDVLSSYKKTNHTYSIFKENPEDGEYSIRDYYKNILDILGNYMEEFIESSTYENGKMHYSFNPPSYTGKLFINLKNSLTNPSKFDTFIKKEYGRYDWFAADADTDKLPKYWLSPLLRMLYENENGGLSQFAQDTRKWLNHKVQLSYRKTPYVELGGLSYLNSICCEFFEDTVDVTSENVSYTRANYRMPIEANKPSSEFITMPRFVGAGYKDTMCSYFFDVFLQELMRIRTVLERASEKKETISYYDLKIDDEIEEIVKRFEKGKFVFSDLQALAGSGGQFHFLSMFNQKTLTDYPDPSVRKAEADVIKYIENFINGKTEKKNPLDKNNNKSGKIQEAFKEAFTQKMNDIVEEELKYFEEIGLYEVADLKGDKKKKYYKYFTRFDQLKDTTLEEQKEFIDRQLENFIWNDKLAAISIIQMTATDLAYYKNVEDFQKRFAQVHAPGLRLNTKAFGAVGKMVNGKREMIRVSDDNSRTMYLKDAERPTGIDKTIKTAFDVLIDNEKENKNKTRRDALKTMKSVVVAALSKTNIADAQAYTSPTGMMKKLTMAGAWTEDMTTAYYRICEGDFDLNDIKTLMQPLKPFVYSQIEKNGSKTMPRIKVGLQNKNSEYMILLADAITRAAGKTSKLTALFDFMESSAYNGRTIYRNGKVYRDNVEVTGKDLKDLLGTRKLKDLKDGEVLDQGVYNAHGIDTIQFESAVKVGLQGKINIDACESYDEIIKLLKDRSTSEIGELYNSNYVHTFSYEDYAIQQEVPAHLRDHHQLMGSQQRILNITDMPFDKKINFKTKDGKIIDNFGELIDLYQIDIAANIIDSFNTLMKDMGLDTDDEGVATEKLSQLLKEEIKKDARYGPDLRRACMLDNGKFVIPLNDPIQSTRIQQLLHSIIKSRINKQKVPGGPVVQTSCYGMEESYKIVFEKDGVTLKYFECAMPVPSEALERDLILLAKRIDDEKDIEYNGRLATPQEAIDHGLITEEQLKAIGYRIPTEDKYSMYPMKIVDWVPRTSGEVIILPAEITTLTGSDFDIDKTYIMLKSFSRNVHVNELYNRLKNKPVFNNKDEKEVKNIIKDWANGNGKNELYNATIESVVLTSRKDKYIHYSEEEYNDRDKRNNEVFDIQWSILTSPEVVDKMFNPGSFDPQKRTARIIQILKANNGENKDLTYKTLSNPKVTLNQLNEILSNLKRGNDNNITNISTQIKFQQQNMTAGKLIGIFANNNVSHGFIQLQNQREHPVKMNFSEAENIYFDGVKLSGEVDLDSIYARDNINYISKNIAGFLAASVDAVKDPVLNYMNLNTFTSGVAMTLIRLGFDVDSVGLFLSQPILIKAANTYANKNNDGYASASDVCIEMLNDLNKDWRNIEDNEDFSKEDLANNLNGGDEEYQIKVLKLFNKLLTKANALNDLTFLTKFNSVSNAAGPTIADTIIMSRRYARFQDSMNGDNPVFNKNANYILEDSAILKAFYSCTVGTDGAASRIFERWFIHYSPAFQRIIQEYEASTKSPIDEKTLNKLVNEYILFKFTHPLANGENAFFDSSDERRSWLINEFPEEFERIKKKYSEELKDNWLIKVITTKEKTKKCNVATLEANTGSFAADTQEEIKNAWADLIKSDNEELAELGKDLFFYCLVRNGFGFSPKTFIHLASVDVKLAMGYIDILNDDNLGGITFNDNDVNQLEFIRQFKRNHSDDAKVVPKFTSAELKKEQLIVDQNVNVLTFKPKEGNDTKRQKFNKLLGSTKQDPVSMIRVDNKLYSLDTNLTKNGDREDWVFVYKEIKPLGNNNNFLEYNANGDSETLTSVIGKKNDKSKAKTNAAESTENTEDLDITDEYGYGDGEGIEVDNEGTAYEFAEDDIPFDTDPERTFDAWSAGLNPEDYEENPVTKIVSEKTGITTSSLLNKVKVINKKQC